MIKSVTNIILVLTLVLLSGQIIYCQEKDKKDEVYDDMSVEELLDVDVVVTASKKPEDLFEAPLSVTIVKKEKILKTGCKTVMEALRLCPGLIVRESTPGNYDIHIRGFDDANKNFYVPIPFNSTILVMIDNRVVFSYFSGGTLWESLPIGVHDIERIEVVRGPASALYGPNAVNGVINIITTNAKEEGLNTFTNVSYGTNGGKSLNASIGYNWKDRTRLTLSTSMYRINRFDRNYFSWQTNSYMSQYDLPLAEELVRDTITRTLWTGKDLMDTLNSYFDEDMSVIKRSFNLFFTHNFSINTKMDLSFGTNNSESQKPGPMNFFTPLSQNKSQSGTFDTRLKIHNWNVHLNMIGGEDLSNFGFNSYEYGIFDFSVEYNWQIFKSLSLRPGIDLRGVVYTSPITDSLTFNFADLKNLYAENDGREVTNLAYYCLGEWKPTPKLRFIAGFRADTFDLYKTAEVNYEIASTYRINKSNFVRLVHSKASRAPFIFDTYLNAVSEKNIQINNYSMPLKQFYTFTNRLKYPTNYTFEAGWRHKPSSTIDFDLEIFGSVLRNLLVSVNNINSEVIFNQEGIVKGSGVAKLVARNHNTSAYQGGLSFNLNYNFSEKLMSSFYGTIQKTTISGNTDYMSSLDTTTKPDETSSNNIFTEKAEYNYTSWSPKSTPTFYGGFLINYRLNDHWNLNLNSYYYTRQTFINNLSMDEEVKLVIDPWADINLKVSYNPFSKFSVNASANNLLGKHRELGGADKIGTSFWLGLQWGF